MSEKYMVKDGSLPGHPLVKGRFSIPDHGDVVV